MTIQRMTNGILLAAIGALAGTFIMIGISEAASVRPVPDWSSRSCKPGRSCLPPRKKNASSYYYNPCAEDEICSGIPAYRCYKIGCPMPRCLSEMTKIDTPAGSQNVYELAAGDIVWTLDAIGQKVAAPLLSAGVVPITAPHGMVEITLADGRSILLSAPHPLTDGRRADQLVAGETYGGSIVASIRTMLYKGAATYDILPAGDTGFYFANGIPMASTLAFAAASCAR